MPNEVKITALVAVVVAVGLVASLTLLGPGRPEGVKYPNAYRHETGRLESGRGRAPERYRPCFQRLSGPGDGDPCDAAPMPIPSPPTLVLLGSGLVAMGRRGR